MAIFEGTVQEFHHFIGPRIRNAINNLTRSHRKKINGICEECGSKKELHSAHVHGSGRRLIIEAVLSKFNTNGTIKCDIGLAERKILEAHHPIENCFKFLCHSCHVEYDFKSKKAIHPDQNQTISHSEKVKKTKRTNTTTSNLPRENLTMSINEILMIKFYVVDGLSYPAAETAVGYL